LREFPDTSAFSLTVFMTLSRKFILRQLLSLLGIIFLGAASVWGFLDLRMQLGEALGGHDQTRTIQEIMINTMRARAAIDGPASARTHVANDLQANIEAIDTLITQQLPGPNHVCTVGSHDQLRHAKAAMSLLKQADRQLTTNDSQPQAAATALSEANDELSALFRLHTDAVHNQTALAGQTTRFGLSSVCGLLAICLAVCSTLSAWQYRGILLPLLKLHEKVRPSLNTASRTDSASSKGFQIEESGEREFSDVARAFNQMTAELDGLHRGMEEMVVAKSTEMVRGERLASVGFLAAGVAHEINNPLNIISGFAELCARQLSKADAGNPAVQETLSALQVIRDEAFRCKEITGRLLSLARGGSETRENVSLKQLVREVALMTRGLKKHRNRKIVLKFSETEPLTVWANANEMKQVVLNLTVNALEAVSPGNGEVRIDGRRVDDMVEITVSDNGKGISAEVIKHVFEPFFTEKRGAAEPGTGLGLTITHAIIQSHGGRISVQSDGPGCGARFTIRLPAVKAIAPADA
jgi:two-component system, NtrC family, sensor kinase